MCHNFSFHSGLGLGLLGGISRLMTLDIIFVIGVISGAKSRELISFLIKFIVFEIRTLI